VSLLISRTWAITLFICMTKI